MLRSSTMLLRAVIVFIGLFVLALCVFLLPAGIASELKGDFDYGYILAGLYVPAVPFFIALHQALALLGNIDEDKTFSRASVRMLKNIKNCAFIISALFLVGMPYIFYVADRDDAPGVALIGFVIIGASFVIGTAAALFQNMLKSAVDMKSENDLTV